MAHKKESKHEKKEHEAKAGHKEDMSKKHHKAESKGMKKDHAVGPKMGRCK